MDYQKLSEELCELHIQYAGTMSRLLSETYARGEDGLLLWLANRNQRTYSADIANHFSLSTGRVANILKNLEQKHMI